MFFIINVDDIIDGAAAWVKWFLVFLFIALPIAFFGRGGIGVYVAIYFGLALSVLLLNIFCIYKAVRFLLPKEVKDKNINTHNIKKRSKIFLISFVVLSVLGLFIPSDITIFNIIFHSSKVFYIILLPILADIVYIFFIYGDEYRNIKNLSLSVWNPIRKILLSLFIPTFIFYWGVLLLYMSATGSAKFHDWYNNVIDMSNQVFTYYNTKYDEVRSNQKTEEIIEQNILEVANTKSYPQEEMEIPKGKFADLFWKDTNDIRYYTYSYIVTKAINNEELKKRGIKIGTSNIIDENTIYLEYSDLATLREKVIKYDLQNNKILEDASYVELDHQFYVNRNEKKNF